MSTRVDFGPDLGAVDFPDDWTEDQINAHLKEHGPKIREQLIAAARDQNAASAESEAGPDTFGEAVGSAAGYFAQGAANTVAGTAKTVGRVLNAAAGYMEPAGADTDTRLEHIAGTETPPEAAKRINSGPLVSGGQAVEDATAGAFPTLPASREGFWTGDVPQGLGNAGSMVAVGLLTGPAGAALSGFGAEADDAYNEEIARQFSNDETIDVDKALVKSLGYGTIAAAIEAKLGAGRIVRGLQKRFGGKTVEEVAKRAIENGASGTFIGRLLKHSTKEGVAGFAEESLQRLAQDLIVHGTPNMEGMAREGAAGGVVQALLGIPATPRGARRSVSERVALDAEASGLPQTGRIIADMSNADEVLTPDLTVADVTGVTGVQIGTQAQTDEVIAAAEAARQAVKAQEILPESDGKDSGTAPEAAVGAVEPIAEPSTQPPNANSSTLSNDAANWDRANRSRRSNEWFEGAMVNSAARAGFDESLKEGGNNLAAHGMAKERTLTGAIQNLENLLRNGLDPSRNRGELHYAPLALATGSAHAGTTAGGTAYRDGPFILVARPGMEFSGKLEGVGAILVNEAHTEITDGLRALVQSIRPDIIVGNFSDAGRITRSLLASKSTAQNTQSNEPAPAESEGSTEPGVRQGDASSVVSGPSAEPVRSEVEVSTPGDQSETQAGARTGGGERSQNGSIPENGRGEQVVSQDQQTPDQPAATPDRVRRFNLGKKQVTVEFPDAVHADLFGFWSRVAKRIQDGEGGDGSVEKESDFLRRNLGIEKVGEAAQAYADEVKELARKAQGDKVTIQAPKYTRRNPVTTSLPPVIRRGKVGDMLSHGEVVFTATGRQTLPFPKIDVSSDRKATATLQRAEAWLRQNAILEAKARGDEFNLRQFQAEKEHGIPQASKDAMEEYLFGDNQSPVIRPALKPLGEGKPQNAPAPPKAPEAPKPAPVEAPPKAASPKDEAMAKILAEREALKKKLREKLGGVSSGIDPEIAVIAAQLAVTYVKEGVVKFPDFARRVKEDMGDIWDGLKVYLHGAWAAAGVHTPEAEESTRKQSEESIAAIDAPAAPEESEEPESKLSWGNQPKTLDGLTVLIRAALDRGETVSTRTFSKLAQEANLDRKEAEEAVEAAIVISARNIAHGPGTVQEKFKKLVDLYRRQPVLGTRTAESKQNQAYSTPAPLAFAAGILADLPGGQKIAEPTVGNAMLTISADPDAVLLLNEFDPKRAERAANVTGQTVSQMDASSPEYFEALKKSKPDRVAMNPPFGSVLEEGGTSNKRFPLVNAITQKTETPSIDLAIMLNTFEAMEKTGKGFAIIGSKTGGVGAAFGSDENRKAAYQRPEFLELFARFKVRDWFTVSGDLYGRQGASFPVDVIIVDGHGPTPKTKEGGFPRPWMTPPRVLKDWDEIGGLLKETKNETPGIGSNSGPAGGSPGAGSLEGNAGEQPGSGRSGGATEPGPRGEGTVPAGSDRGDVRKPAKSDAVSDRSSVDQSGRADESGERGELGQNESGESKAAEGGNNLERRKAGQLNAPYVSVSKNSDPGLVAPSNLADPMREAVRKLEAETGMGVDEFTADRLGMPLGETGEKNPDTLFGSFSSAQIEAVGLMIHKIESTKTGIINSDQTGVGKGRTVAALIRYALRIGKIPVFVTKTKTLYSDMAGRDLKAIGVPDFVPFITDSDYSYLAGDGTIIEASPGSRKQREAMWAAANAGKLPPGHQGIFTTYDQLKSDTPDNWKEEPKTKAARKKKLIARPDGPRLAMLRKLAPNAIFVLDEAHEAAGMDSEVGLSLQSIIPSTAGTYFTSATFAKTPKNLTLYAQGTSMRLAGLDAERLEKLFLAGGVPLQQGLTAMLAENGEFVRREQNMDGVDFQFVKAAENADAERDAADLYTGFLHDLKKIGNQVTAAGEEMSDSENQERADEAKVDVTTTNFGSRLFNLSNQYLFSLRANATSEKAIEALKNGEKPFIAVYNTMEGPIADLKDMGLPLTFGGILRREMRKMLKVTIKDPTAPADPATGAKKGQRIVFLEPEDLPDGGAHFRKVEQQIDASDFGAFPISPIDFIKKRIRDAGFSIGEITARKGEIDEAEDGEAKVVQREKEDFDRYKILSDYNHGKLDAIIVNGSGSTGLSAHTDPAFKDQRVRHMIVAQPAPDINVFMQFIGRVMRFGQTKLPRYTVISTSLPGETRFMTMLRGKLTSLNANTTSDTESGITQTGMANDIFNRIGDQVVEDVIRGEPEAAMMADISLPDPKEEGIDGFARKATGKLVLLPVEDAERIWTNIMETFTERVRLLDEAGENPLKADITDLQAKTTAVAEVAPKFGEGPFAGPVKLERVEIVPQGKPPTVEEIVQLRKDNRAKVESEVSEWMGKWGAAKDERLRVMRERKMTTDQIAATVKNFDEAKKAVEDAMEMLGRPFGFGATSESGGKPQFYVVPYQIKLKGKANSDFTAKSRHELVVGTNTAQRRRSIPLSQLDLLKPASESTEDPKLAWDETAENGTTRYVVTGNLLKGFEASFGLSRNSNAPRVTIYSTRDGQVKAGVLLAPNFDPTNAGSTSGETMTEIKSADEFRNAVNTPGTKLISSGETGLKISAERDGILVKVKSSGAGRVIWGDRQFNQLFVNNPIQKGSFIEGKLWRNEAGAFFNWLKQKGVNVGTKMEASSGGGIQFTELDAAKQEVKDAYGGLKKMGISPRTQAEAQLRFYKALVRLARAYIAQGVASAADFASKVNLKLNAAVESAFADAMAGIEVASASDLSARVRKQIERMPDPEPVMVTASAQRKPAVVMDGKPMESEAVAWLTDPKFIYRRETHRGRQEAANQIIAAFKANLREALNFVRSADPASGVTDSIAEVTAAEIANRAQEKVLEAKNPMDRREWSTLRDDAIRLAKGKLSSEGQGLQAGNQVRDILGAGAAVFEYEDRVRTLRDRKLAKKFPEIVSTKIKDWLYTSGQRAVAEIKKAMADADNVVAREMKAARKDYGKTWAEIMQDSAKAQGNHRMEIYRRILAHPALKGLDTKAALELANLLGKAWERERMHIFRREFAKVIKLPEVSEEDMVKLEASIPEFIKQINLGLWDNEAFRNAIAPKYGVKPVSEEASRRIYAAAQDAQDAPEGAQRQTKYRNVAQMIAREAGVPIGDMIRGWWYASVLSGAGTQSRNFIGNAAQLVDNFTAFAARDAKMTPRLIGSMLRGMAQNASGEFGAILKRGQESGGRVAEDVRDPGSAAEVMAKDKRMWAKVFSSSRYVGRFMTAVDSFFYAANAEMMAEFMAVRQGREDGVTNSEEMDRYVSELLKTRPEDIEAATAQAESEAAEGKLSDKAPGTVKRRAFEILAQSRPLDIRQEMHRYALEATLNNHPEGVLGAIANSIIALRSRYPVLTPIVPFVRISANVTNMLLDHSPAGLVKLIAARPDAMILPGIGDFLRYPNRRLSVEQWQQLRAKVLISSAIAMGLALKAALDLDDDEPAFQITGSLEGLTPAQRQQLEQEGVKRYQVRFGKHGFDYRQTPYALMFAMIGNYLDGVRYGKFDEKEDSVRLASVLAAGHGVIVDQSFLSGLQTILDRGPQGGNTQLGDRVGQQLASTVGGMTPRMLKDIDQIVNPDLKQARGFWENLVRETPVARWSLRDRRNVLGEVVQRPAHPWTWSYSGPSDDPVWQALQRKAQAGVFLPVPSASARVFQNGTRVKMTDEQFDEYTRLTGEGYRKEIEKNLGAIEKMSPKAFEAWIKTHLAPIREQARSRVR